MNLKSMDPITIVTISLSVFAMSISVIALIYTIRSFLQKNGLKINGSFLITSGFSCDDLYLSGITLENQKDRNVAVYKIYLRISYGYYILIEDFRNKPLILQPFEGYKKDYDPIEFYSTNMDRITLNNLLENKKVHKHIVLTTSEGKYVVKKHSKHWSPITIFFKNHFTANIRIKRVNFKGSSYGENTKYIVVFKTSDDQEEVVPIYPDDYKIGKFSHFQLTKDSLESKEKVEEYLYDKLGSIESGCSDVIVYDYKEWQQDIRQDDRSIIRIAEKRNWFSYYIVGVLYTKMSDYKLKKINQRNRKNRSKK